MKQDKNFKLPRSVKRIIAALPTKEARSVWRRAYVWAWLNDSNRMVMSYEVSPSGKIPRKVLEKANVDSNSK